MVATAILSLGTVLIYEGFLIFVDSFNYYATYLDLAPKIDEKIWLAQNSLTCYGPEGYVQPEGKFVRNSKFFNWNMSHKLIDQSKYSDLYKIDFFLYWQEGEKTKRILRNAYAIYRKEEE
jgi:hypothetical protein